MLTLELAGRRHGQVHTAMPWIVMTIAQRLSLKARAVIRVVLAVSALSAASTAAAQTGQTSEPFSWLTLAMGAVGGLAFFLYEVRRYLSSLNRIKRCLDH
jgi:hypothetical protein